MLLSLLTTSTFIVTRVDGQHTWTVEVVDSGNSTGSEVSLVLDSLGHPHVSYGSNRTIRYAYRNDSGWRTEQVDSGGICGLPGTSIALDSYDRPWIAYSGAWDANCWDYDVRLAHWDGTAWEVQIVNPPNVRAGNRPSVIIDARDRPHVAYYSDILNMTYKLTYAVWNGSAWDYQNVETTGWNSGDPADISLKLDSKEWPHIAYGADLGHDPRYLHWNGTQWLAETPDPSANPEYMILSLALDSKDFPWISYTDLLANGIKCAHWDGTQWIVEKASLPGETKGAISIAIDSKNIPHMAYAPPAPGLPDVLYYKSRLGGTWISEIADPTLRVADVSLAMDSHDEPRIAYMRWSGPGDFDAELRYAYAPWVDTYPPVSRILPISPYWNGSPIQANATDESGVANVTLWYRFSGDNSTWASWTQFSTLTSPPWVWSFTYSRGEGYYEYYSIAFDIVGNVEPPPTTANAREAYDITPPVSSVLHISPYWHTAPSIVVDATARDNLSGVADVTLFYSHAPLDNSTWSPWILLGTETAPPWSWPFPFPDGEGHYKFHTIARDVAGNVEGAKTIAEAVAGYMTPPDYVPINPQPSSPRTIGLSRSLQLSIEVRNQGGNASVSSTISFFDSLAPSTPFASFQVPPIPAGGTSGPFTATWTSPATRCSCSVSAFADSDNNVTESNESNNMYAWTVNVVPGPITSLVIGNPNYTSTATYVRSSTPLDFSVVDQSGLGIRNTTYRVDRGNLVNYTATGTFFLAREGVRTIEWRSLDWAGNLEETDSMALTVDDTPPATTVSIGEPKYLNGGNFVKSLTPLALSVTDGGVGSNSTFYRLWDGFWSSWREYTTPFNLAGMDGTWFVEFLSFDYLGNGEAVRNETLFLDDTPPATTISPATGEFTTDTVFTLAASDAGSGVNVTMYGIDGGSWITYSGGFTLPEGVHNVSYHSSDMLNNTEREKWLVVTVQGQPPPPGVTVNYKPLVALLFAVILAVVGLWSSKKRPWKGGKDRVAVARAFALMSVPFVLAEAATGVLSLSFESLRIPPLIGWGTFVDCTILAVGLLLLVARSVRDRGSKIETSSD